MVEWILVLVLAAIIALGITQLFGSELRGLIGIENDVPELAAS